MVGVELRLTPEAIEVVADRAAAQGAGADGVRTILEKLLLEVKFELPNSSEREGEVEAVEITEDFVMGKAPPTFYFRGQHRQRQQQQQQQQQLRLQQQQLQQQQKKTEAPVRGDAKAGVR